MPDRELEPSGEITTNRWVTSLRLSAEVGRWVAGEAKLLNASINDYLTGLVEDRRTIYSLPASIVGTLDSDRRALGLTWRAYVLHLLSSRYDEVRARGPGYDQERVPMITGSDAFKPPAPASTSKPGRTR